MGRLGSTFTMAILIFPKRGANREVAKWQNGKR